MNQIHDVDVLLLLATTTASKRRPAELIDLIAAIDLLQEPIPLVAKMSESIARLAVNGLISQVDGGLLLTPAAENVMTGLRRKGETDQRLFALKEKLGDYNPTQQSPVIQVTPKQLEAAVLAHKTSAASPVKNLLAPKPKAAEEIKKPGQRQRKPMPTGIRKAAPGRPRKG